MEGILAVSGMIGLYALVVYLKDLNDKDPKKSKYDDSSGGGIIDGGYGGGCDGGGHGGGE